ncbi:hypothetical protein D1632_10775 [Chryseobacterium nematophagum]|uniref:Uncharacterized protein n=1 Tax=Chryseobacterium nematophagum TaxID=2305228 RepID=A0A3M7LDE9_9FLAO|nr:hypothetical protein [Chryseobacterium nematophagum]RMZ60064.1 hypothetical protein D1632_10775 [Chryseobacterium nematophagum]
MSLSEKIKRLKKALAETDDSCYAKTLKAIIVGMTNFHLGLFHDVAKRRFEDYCKNCAFNIQEPISDMRVQDEKVPELSERMCAHCMGCVLSYKLRQSVKPCEFWK